MKRVEFETVLRRRVDGDILYPNLDYDRRLPLRMLEEKTNLLKQWVDYCGYRLRWDRQHKCYQVKAGFLDHIHDKEWEERVGINEVRVHDPEKKWTADEENEVRNENGPSEDHSD